MQFLANYGLFLLEVITLVVAILVVIIGIVAILSKGKLKDSATGKIKITKLNDHFNDTREHLNKTILPKAHFKQFLKQRKQQQKSAKKQPDKKRKRIYILDFHGDIKASQVSKLRQEITAILLIAAKKDEVVLRLESPGGLVHGYGLAASQLQRLRERDIPLIVAVDKVAASGGYMMACVATKIISAPFAVIGSIGVVAQIPNLHRLLKKNDIDVELMMAGEYKRTLTMFAENTEKGRQKFQEDIDETHALFKQFISEHRSVVTIDKIATGEHWYGQRALDLKLVDTLMTSDDYLLNAANEADLYQIKYSGKKSLSEKLFGKAQALVNTFLYRQAHIPHLGDF